MGTIDSIYLSLPAKLQNVVISTYGLRQRWVRGRAGVPVEYANLLDVELSLEAIRSAQESRLRALVRHAFEHVPYYIDLANRQNIAASDVSLDNFDSIFPILEKQEVTSNPARFHSKAVNRTDLQLFTSGTSGSPMSIRCTREGRAINYAFFNSIIERSGCRPSDRSVTFAGRVLFADTERRQFWRKDYANRTLYCSSYYISPQTIAGYVKAMEQWDPQYIDTYPSALYEIARLINSEGIRHRIRPKFILTSSETLTEQCRHELETAFSCKVVDQYGCTELAVMAYQFGGRYIVPPMYSLVEFPAVGGTDHSAVVCTGLLNFAMPLIRYRIGDLVSDAQWNPKWRFQTASFGAVVGREDDCVVTPEGRRIGRMDPVFKGIEGISKAQLVQNDPGSIDVLIIRSSSGSFDESQLKQNIRNRTSQSMEIRIREVADIPLTKAGKFKAVISNVKPR